MTIDDVPWTEVYSFRNTVFLWRVGHIFNSWFCTAMQLMDTVTTPQCKQMWESPQSAWCSLPIPQVSVKCWRPVTTHAHLTGPQTATSRLLHNYSNPRQKQDVFSTSALWVSGNEVNPTSRENATRVYRCCTKNVHNTWHTVCLPLPESTVTY